MNKVKIITDSCSDLTLDLMEKYDIDYAKVNIVYKGTSTPASPDWTPEDVHKYYGKMREGERYSTIQVTVDEFNRVFTKYLEQNYDIIYISCSVKQSNSIITAQNYSKELMRRFPDQKLYCIDSFNACIGEGLLALEAAKMAKNNCSAEEIQDWLIANRKKVNEFFTVPTLEYMKKAGRVKGSTAFLGNLMGIKPIIIADVNGYQAAYKKVKGRENSLKEIVNLMKAAKENQPDAEKQIIYLAHADCSQKEVNYLVEMIKENIPCKEIYIGYIGPAIGATTGPDAIGIWSLGKEVTFSISN